MRSFDRDRRSLFRDREVIADLCLIKRSQGDRDREIWGSRSCDRAIFSLNKTEIFQSIIMDNFRIWSSLDDKLTVLAKNL